MTPARRGRRQAARAEEPPVERHAAMTWAQRLQRMFKIEIEICEACGGKKKVIACIEDPAVITRLLAPLASPQVGATPRTPTARPATTDTTRPKKLGRRRIRGREARSDPASAYPPRARFNSLTAHSAFHRHTTTGSCGPRAIALGISVALRCATHCKDPCARREGPGADEL